MKKLTYLLFAGFCTFALGASVNFKGHFRGESNYFNKLALSSGPVKSKAFLLGRFLLNPEIVIDDHFVIHSQWSLLTSPAAGFTPSPLATNSGTSDMSLGQGGYIFGDQTSAALILSRAWLEWTSDFGVFRAGRMPFSWGYGILWDGGNNLWDDFQTTVDRLEYRLFLGNVAGGLAYSKPRKSSVLDHKNDADFYMVYLYYDNAESEMQMGIAYERQVRSTSQGAALMAQAGILGTPGLTLTPYPLSNNVLDGYLKKTVGYFSFGIEGAWLVGNAVDFNADGKPDDLDALAGLVNVTYAQHQIKAFLDVLYASGDSNLSSGTLNGFVLLHRNKRPGLILGRELVGPFYGENAQAGSLVAYGAANTFSGVYYIRPGFSVDWSQSWTTGIELVFAGKPSVPAGGARSLGMEIDLGVEHRVYNNCVLGGDFGMLIPGNGLLVPNPSVAFAAGLNLGIIF